MNKIQGETDSKFYPNFLPGKDNGFEPYEGIITQAKTGGTNDLESMALIASGAVRKQGKELVYVDGTVYMDASGQVVNPYTIDKYNEQWWQTHASKISSNIGKIGYKPGSKGNEDATSQAISRTAKMFLQFNPDIRARIPDEKKAPSGNLNEEGIRAEIANQGKKEEAPKDKEGIETEPPMVANTSNAQLKGRAGVGTGSDYMGGIKSAYSQLQENLKSQKQVRAEKKLERLNNLLAEASPSQVAQLEKQINKQKELIKKYNEEALASK